MEVDAFSQAFREIWSKPANVHQKLLEQDILIDKIPISARQSLTRQAEQVGRALAQRFQKHPQELKDLLASLTIASLPNDQDNQPYYTFGAFKMNQVILLNDALLEDAQHFFESNQFSSLIGENDLRDLVLMHEVFHAAEYKMNLWTIQKHLSFRVAFFNKQTRIYALSEIAASQFVQVYFHLTNTPILLNSCILYPKNAKLAAKMLREFESK